MSLLGILCSNPNSNDVLLARAGDGFSPKTDNDEPQSSAHSMLSTGEPPIIIRMSLHAHDSDEQAQAGACAPQRRSQEVLDELIHDPARAHRSSYSNVYLEYIYWIDCLDSGTTLCTQHSRRLWTRSAATRDRDRKEDAE